MHDLGACGRIRSISRVAFAAACWCALGGLLLLASSQSHASTPIQGVLEGQHEWTRQHSPYLVSGQVRLADGASLRIEAGVHVAFAQDAALTVADAWLLAEGEAGAEVVFTSSREVFGGDGDPAPGDWGGLRFMPTDSSESSRLVHSIVRFGHGLSIEGASPQLHNTHFEFNHGAAISLDLQGSPQGIGLSARGNGIDGILLQPGDIRSNVRWGLVGIPYVLMEGQVSVGGELGRIEPAFRRMPFLATAALSVEMGHAAPTGGLVIALSCASPCPLTFPASVVVAEGEASAAITVTASSYEGTARLRASLPGWIDSLAEIEVFEPPAIIIEPSEPTVPLGGEARVLVSLPGLATGENTTVHVSRAWGEGLGFPAQLEVVGGEPAVLSLAGTALGSAGIKLSAEGHAEAIVRASVERFRLQAPAQVRVSPGYERPLQVALTHQAPAGGVELSIAVDNALVDLPATVFVEQGATDVSLVLQGLQGGIAQITIDAPGYEPAQVEVQVAGIDIVPVHHASHTVVIDGFVLPVTTADALSFQLSPTSPYEDLMVSITSLDPGVALVDQAQLMVERGAMRPVSPFVVQAIAEGEARVRLQLPGHPAVEFPVSIIAPPQLEIAWDTPFDGEGVFLGAQLQTPEGSVRVRRTRNGNPLSLLSSTEVQLVSSNPAAADAVARYGEGAVVTIPGGSAEADIVVRGHVAQVSRVDLTAVAEAHEPAPAVPLWVKPPLLGFSELPEGMVVFGPRWGFQLQWTVQDASGGVHHQAPIADVEIALDAVSEGPHQVIDGFYAASWPGAVRVSSIPVRAGSLASDRVYIGSPIRSGSFHIAAVPKNGMPASNSEPIAVSGSELRFRQAELKLGRGFQNNINMLTIEHLRDGVVTPVGSDIAIDMELVDSSNSGPQLGFLHSRVVVHAGQPSAGVVVRAPLGLEPGRYAIRAVPESPALDAVEFEVEVVPVAVDLWAASPRAIGSARDPLTVSLYPTNGATPWGQVLTDPVEAVISLETVGGAEVIDGIYASFTGGKPLEAATLNAGGSHVSLYQGTPLRSGSYRIIASVPGLGSSGFDVEVLQAELRFFKAEMSPSFTTAGGSWNERCGSQQTDVVYATSQTASQDNCYEYWLGRGLRSTYWSYWAVGAFVGDERVCLEGSTEIQLATNREFINAPEAVLLEPSHWDGCVAAVPLAGLEVTGEPVELHASAQGLVPTATPITVHVVEPRLVIRQQRNPRPVDDAHPAEIEVRLVVPQNYQENEDSDMWRWQTEANEDFDIGIAIVEAQPASIVDGLVDWQGAPVERVAIGEGSIAASGVYAPPPSALGHYELVAEHPGISEPGRLRVEVIEARLDFNRASLTVDRSSHTGVDSWGSGLQLSWGYGPENQSPAPHTMGIRLYCEDAQVCSAGGACPSGDESCPLSPPSVVLAQGMYSVPVALYGLEIGSTRLRAEVNGELLERWVEVEITPTRLGIWSQELQAYGEGVVEVTRGGWVDDGQYSPIFFRPLEVNLTSDSPATVSVGDGAIRFESDQTWLEVEVSTGTPGETVLRLGGPGTSPVSETVHVVEPGKPN